MADPAGVISIPAWTIDEACAEFARTGRPMTPAQLRVIIRHLPQLRPVGATPSGNRGGRGHALYPISDLQRLHAALAPWLRVPLSGECFTGNMPASDAT